MFEINFLLCYCRRWISIHTLGSLTSLVCVVILFLREIRKKIRRNAIFYFLENFICLLFVHVYKCSGLLTFPTRRHGRGKGQSFFFLVFNWTQQLREKIINWLFGNERRWRWIEYSRPHGLFKVSFFFVSQIFFFFLLFWGGKKNPETCAVRECNQMLFG